MASLSKSETTIFGIIDSRVGVVVGVESRLTAGHFGQKVSDCHSKLFQIMACVFVAFSGDKTIWENLKDEIMLGSFSSSSSVPELADEIAKFVTKFVKAWKRQYNEDLSVDLVLFGTIDYRTEPISLFSIKKRNDKSLEHTAKHEAERIYIGGAGGGEPVRRWLRENQVPVVDDVELLINYVFEGVKAEIRGSFTSGGGIQVVAITPHNEMIHRKWVPIQQGCNSPYVRADQGPPSP